MLLPSSFNWKRPDYTAMLRQRMAALQRIREHPETIPVLMEYYRDHLSDFITDWGVTDDPRLVDLGQPSVVPFILFDKQREFVDYVVDRWRARRRGLVEKSRDMGVTWLTIATSATLCLFHDGMKIGFGSRTEPYVDKIGEPKSIFERGRLFMEHLPIEFRRGWTRGHAPFMRMMFPETRSTWTGEVGENIGRGDRTSIYFVDEAAHLQYAASIEKSLSQTTNCRIDVSSVNGMNNEFAKNRHSGRINVFIFDWHDDPRKDEEWYARQQMDLDPVVVAQEIDRDYSASVEGIVIPGAWVRAAVGAFKRLGIGPTGRKRAALDVADEGGDLNALCCTEGVTVSRLEEWSGRGTDLFATTQKAFEICDEFEAEECRYDADGLGAGIRGDARIVNATRMAQHRPIIRLQGFRGSAGVIEPEGEDIKGRKNKDYFMNLKAQGWWNLRQLFQRTYRRVALGMPCEPDHMINLDPDLPLIHKLVTELSQPTFSLSPAGKIQINKMPEGLKSPNLADSVMIRFARMQTPLVVSEGTLRRAAMARPRRGL